MSEAYFTAVSGAVVMMCLRLVFYTSFVLKPLPVCFITEQSTVKASLFVKKLKWFHERIL